MQTTAQSLLLPWVQVLLTLGSQQLLSFLGPALQVHAPLVQAWFSVQLFEVSVVPFGWVLRGSDRNEASGALIQPR